jgi:hypothetical protein
VLIAEKGFKLKDPRQIQDVSLGESLPSYAYIRRTEFGQPCQAKNILLPDMKKL